MSIRPTVLTIAGFDPSGCAGFLADVKTLESHQVNAMAVCTANTIQNISEFRTANWINIDEILSQLNLLQDETEFEYVKIGLVESFTVLQNIVDELLNHNKKIKIIWDPICKASSQFEFHKGIDKTVLENICSKLYLITPNLDEVKLLVPNKNVEDAGKYLSQFCNVLIKGGHSVDETSVDILFTSNSMRKFNANKLNDYSKRGTGCVLSSAILANLANGMELTEACANAKKYITNYLTSNKSLVGHHHYEEYK